MHIKLTLDLVKKIEVQSSSNFLREIITGEKQCVFCLDLFKAKQKNSICCSLKCKQKFRNSKNAEINAKKVSELRQCSNCLGLFKAKINKQVYCSKKCRNKSRYSKPLPHTPK